MENTKLCYPTVETWFIVWDDARENILSYGSIEPTQCMETKWSEVDYHNNEGSWNEALLDNGIDLEPEQEDIDIEQVVPDVEF